MFSEQIRLQLPPKWFGVNSWIVQMIRQWIPECWSGDRKCTGPKGAAANSRNWQLMTSGRSQMLVTRNFGAGHAVLGEVPWSSVAKTTMDCHNELVLHSLRNNQPVLVVMYQPRQTMLIFPCDQMCCSILNMLQLVYTKRSPVLLKAVWTSLLWMRQDGTPKYIITVQLFGNNSRIVTCKPHKPSL